MHPDCNSLAYDFSFGGWTPIATIETIVPVISHHEILALGDHHPFRLQPIVSATETLRSSRINTMRYSTDGLMGKLDALFLQQYSVVLRQRLAIDVNNIIS